ncbi:hypothetical protein BJX65DRAFT_297718 [Aspergillus insuetus]
MESPLLSCPADVLHLILEPLGQVDLAALCLTCADLAAIARPRLYSNIRLPWMRNGKSSAIVLLLSTIVQRPELADLIHTLHLSGNDIEPSPTYNNTPSPRLQVTDTDVQSMVQCIQALNVLYRDLWIEGLTTGNMDAVVALLLCQLSELRYLHLEETFSRKSRFVVYCVYPRLGIDIRDTTDARNTTDVLPFFYLPSIEDLTTSIDNPVVTLEWPAAHQPKPLILRSLDVSMLREGHLGDLLSLTSNLKRLEWNWYYRPDLKDRWVTDVINLDNIAEDLSRAGGLTEITIHASADMSQAETEFPPLTITGLGAFRRLDNLKRLQVPLPFLLGFQVGEQPGAMLSQVPPRSIEVLTMTNALYLQQEWEWSDDEATPHLKRFNLLLEIVDLTEWAQRSDGSSKTWAPRPELRSS